MMKLHFPLRLSNNNAQGEYYLTDVIAMAVSDGLIVATEQPIAVMMSLSRMPKTSCISGSSLPLPSCSLFEPSNTSKVVARMLATSRNMRASRHLSEYQRLASGLRDMMTVCPVGRMRTAPEGRLLR